MVSFKGAHFPQDIIFMGVRWYVALSIKLSTCRRTDGGARGVDRPRDHPALGREIQSPLGLDFGHSRIDPLQTRQERAGAVRKLGDVWWEGRHHEITQPPMPLQ
jgi:hypothetical protein